MTTTTTITLAGTLEETGNALHAARKAARLTQKQVSQLTGIDQANISRIEQGKLNPTLTTLLRLCEATGWQLTVSREG